MTDDPKASVEKLSIRSSRIRPPNTPNPQAAALVLLVRRYPDMVARLDEVTGG